MMADVNVRASGEGLARRSFALPERAGGHGRVVPRHAVVRRPRGFVALRCADQAIAGTPLTSERRRATASS